MKNQVDLTKKLEKKLLKKREFENGIRNKYPNIFKFHKKRLKTIETEVLNLGMFIGEKIKNNLLFYNEFLEKSLQLLLEKKEYQTADTISKGVTILVDDSGISCVERESDDEGYSYNKKIKEYRFESLQLEPLTDISYIYSLSVVLFSDLKKKITNFISNNENYKKYKLKTQHFYSISFTGGYPRIREVWIFFDLFYEKEKTTKQPPKSWDSMLNN